MNTQKSMMNLILKAVAMAMAVASIVLGILGESTVDTYVTLLGIGLFALAVAAMRSETGQA